MRAQSDCAGGQDHVGSGACDGGLNNKPGRGAHTRKRLAAVLKDYKNGAQILAELGWDERGRIVPRGEFQGTGSVPSEGVLATDGTQMKHGLEEAA
jgi:hypothetical protein